MIYDAAFNRRGGVVKTATLWLGVVIGLITESVQPHDTTLINGEIPACIESYSGIPLSGGLSIANKNPTVMPISVRSHPVKAVQVNLPESASQSYWPDGSTNHKTINRPNPFCWLDVCKNSNCDPILLVADKASSIAGTVPQKPLTAFTEEANKPEPWFSPLLTFGTLVKQELSAGNPFLRPPLASRTSLEDFLPDKQKNTIRNNDDRDWLPGHDPQWSFDSETDTLRLEPQKVPETIDLSLHHQPLLLVRGNIYYRKVYMVYWDTDRHLQVLPWLNQEGPQITNADQLTLGIADRERLNDHQAMWPELPWIWAYEEAGGFSVLLEILRQIYGDMVRTVNHLDDTVYWFHDHQGNMHQITQEQLIRMHSLYHESLKSDIAERIIYGEPLVSAKGVDPQEYKGDQRIVPHYVFRLIEKELLAKRRPYHTLPFNPIKTDEEADKLQENGPTQTSLEPEIGMPLARHQEVRDEVRENQFVPFSQESSVQSLQNQIDRFIDASSNGDTQTMRRLSFEADKEWLLKSHHSSFPKDTALHAAIRSGHESSQKLIESMANSLHSGLYEFLLNNISNDNSEIAINLVHGDGLPQENDLWNVDDETEVSSQEFAVSRQPEGSHAESSIITMGGIMEKLSLDDPLSRFQQCSEGRLECAAHPGIYNGVIHLPCCKRYICEDSLMKLLSVFMSDLSEDVSESTHCLLCNESINVKNLLTQSIELLNSGQSEFSPSVKHELLPLLDEMYDVIKTQFTAATQLDYKQATCVICFDEKTCFKLPECQVDCITCRECFADFISGVYQDQSSDYLSESGLQCSICKALIPDFIIKHIKGRNALERINKNVKLIVARKSKDMLVCKCDTIIDLTKVSQNRVSCPSCPFEICRLCLAQWHEGICRQDENFDTLVRENPDDFKRCPGCQVLVSKDDACNKVVCATCKTAFCWQCLEKLGGDPYEHFQKTNCLLADNRSASANTVNSSQPVRLLNRCPLCSTDRYLKQFLCGHTHCGKCEMITYQFLQRFGHDLHVTCLLCLAGIDKQQEITPPLEVPIGLVSGMPTNYDQNALKLYFDLTYKIYYIGY
ncbi:MAG: IBR domain-containing protein, partial [Endozoicomonas sp.]